MMSDSTQHFYGLTQRHPAAMALGCAAVAGVAAFGLVTAVRPGARAPASPFVRPVAAFVDVVTVDDGAAPLRAAAFREAPVRSTGTCGDDRPAQTTVADARGAGQHFDFDSIASFLRATHHGAVHGKQGKTSRRVALALTNLDADGIAGDTSPPAAVKPAPFEPVKPGAKIVARADAPQSFEARLGPIKTGAQAGVLNGQPAAALSVGLMQGPVTIDAQGMSEVTNLSEPGVFRKTFKLSTRASIPFN